MARRELLDATYRDTHGVWPARAWLEDGSYRAVIHGVLFEGGLDIFEPALRSEVAPKAPEPERTPGGHAVWRPSIAELRRIGDRYEARTPYGDHRGVVVQHESGSADAPAGGVWQPLTVAAGFCSDGSPRTPGKKFTPVAFHAACVARLEKKLGLTLVKQSRATYSSPDNAVRVQCSISRFHERVHNYWFAFHPHQREFLDGAPTAHVAFGCGDAKRLFVIPYQNFKVWLPSLHRTELPDGRAYWHVKIHETGKSYSLVTRSGTAAVDLTPYLLRD